MTREEWIAAANKCDAEMQYASVVKNADCPFRNQP